MEVMKRLVAIGIRRKGESGFKIKTGGSMFNKSIYLDKLIWDGKPFFSDDNVSIEVIKNVKQLDNKNGRRRIMPFDVKMDIINIVFHSFYLINKFLMITGRSDKNSGYIALVFSSRDVSRNDLDSLEHKVHAFPVGIIIRCFAFDIDVFDRLAELDQ